jgi:FlaA1/EpsC-like NDP-sugar epimerase
MDLKRKDLPNKYLLLVDLCCIAVSFLLSAWIRYGGLTNQWPNVNVYGVAFAIVLLLYIVIYYFYDTYSKLFKRGYFEEMGVVVKINAWLAVCLTLIMYLFQEGSSYSRLFFLCFFC